MVVVSSGVKVDTPAWAPRDMEFEKIRLMARDAVLATFAVPPSRVGLPTANYATQREQMATYWQALVGTASLFDAAYTQVARTFDPSLSVYHDFGGVQHLQESRTDRLYRVQTWVDLGASPAAAAAYEGFADAPVEDIAAEDGTLVPVGGEVVADTGLNGAQISALLEILAAVSAGTLTVDGAVRLILVALPMLDEEDARAIAEGAIELPTVADGTAPESVRNLHRLHVIGHMRRVRAADPVARMFGFASGGTVGNLALAAPDVVARGFEWGVRLDAVPTAEEDRAALSASFVARAYDPTRRRIELAALRGLKRQARLIADALGEQELPTRSVGEVVTRDLVSDLLALIFDDAAIGDAMRQSVQAAIRKAIADAYAQGLSQVGTDTVFDPSRFSLRVNRQMASLIVNTNATTKQRVRELLANRIAAGARSEERRVGKECRSRWSPYH